MPPAQGRSPRPVRAALLAVGLAAVVGAAVWRWTRSENKLDRGQAGAPKKRSGKNPTLSLSFPVDTELKNELTHNGALQNNVDGLLAQLQVLFQVHALICSPSGEKPALPGVETLRTLPYSTAEGRAMLARALQCQCHVELVIVNENGYASLWNGEANQGEELASYCTRLEQLARQVDTLVVAFVPGVTSSGVKADAVLAAYKQHAVSARSNTHLVEATDADGWTALAQTLALQRDAWN